MDVDVKGGGHVIISGNRKDIMDIRVILGDYSIKPNFIPFEKLLDLGEDHNCIMIGSHPFRDSHKLYLQPKELLSRLHALDLNATDIFTSGHEKVEKEVLELSKQLNIPYVTGSDSHYPIQLGSVKTILNIETIYIKELIEIIKRRDFSINISNTLKLKVYSAKITKAHIKVYL